MKRLMTDSQASRLFQAILDGKVEFKAYTMCHGPIVVEVDLSTVFTDEEDDNEECV